jgi:hypothetical protein
MKLPKLPASDKILRVACVLGLVALPLMVWSIFDPTVWPVLVALSLGQAVGTVSFLLFLVVVARDLALARRLRSDGIPQAPPSTKSLD